MKTASEAKKSYYFFLDKSGSAPIAALASTDENLNSGTIICIDNNVCQHLAQFGKVAQNDVVREKIENFLNSCAEFDLPVFPYIGLAELATSRVTGKLDRSKYISHLKGINECLKKHGVRVAPQISDFSNGMSKFMALHDMFYVHLLKIKTLEHNGLDKEKSLSNLTAYIDWAEEIRIQTMFPSQVAFALFGGESKARKIAKFEKDKAPLQSIWGAAWDMLYLFISQQYVPLKIQNVTMIFATNDEALWLIGSLFNLRGAITVGGKVQRSIGELSYDFPHYHENKAQIEGIHQRVLAAQAGRFGKAPDVALLHSERRHLEKTIEAANIA